MLFNEFINMAPGRMMKVVLYTTIISLSFPGQIENLAKRLADLQLRQHLVK